MVKVIHRFGNRLVYPTGRTIALGLRLNYLIWIKYFDAAWARTPIHEKLTWLLFITNTLCIITILSFISFR